MDTIAALCRAGWGHRLLLSHDLAAYLAFWDSWETTKLEKEMGISIFNRSSKGIALSSQGMEFLSYARQVLE